MQNLKCQCCFKLLAKTKGFDHFEIKCPRCKTLNTFQSTPSALPECLEHQTQSGKIHDTKPLTTIEVKTKLVLKTMDVIRNGRLEYDAGWTDLSQSLMSIKKTLTASQRQMTFTAGRSEEIGHADLAWSLMHALYNEPLEGQTQMNQSFMEIY